MPTKTSFRSTKLHSASSESVSSGAISSESASSGPVSSATSDRIEQTTDAHQPELDLFFANRVDVNHTYETLSQQVHDIEGHHNHFRPLNSRAVRTPGIPPWSPSPQTRVAPKPWGHPSPVTHQKLASGKLKKEKRTFNVLNGVVDWLVNPQAFDRGPSKRLEAQPLKRSHPTPSPIKISNMQYIVVGLCVLMAAGLMVDVRRWIPQSSVSDICLEIVRPDAILSRTHLTQLLSVSERTSKTAVQQVIAEPYCRLSAVNIRAGVTAQREAYPLEFDPDTWLVMLYEGDEYAGFDFSFQK